MHPQWRQVPPNLEYFSMRATFKPSWLPFIAATYPPGPLPRIATSKRLGSVLNVHLFEVGVIMHWSLSGHGPGESESAYYHHHVSGVMCHVSGVECHVSGT